MIDLTTVAVLTLVLLTLTGVALGFSLWKESKVVQLDHQHVERRFNLHVDKR